mmetsp:Transcript_12472/g.37400  ORF Transcript_12472/g.37400 Transcript_12472/m.37400 type:complete len:730 (-) Transcript_12472:1884-4073(-)
MTLRLEQVLARHRLLAAAPVVELHSGLAEGRVVGDDSREDVVVGLVVCGHVLEHAIASHERTRLELGRVGVAREHHVHLLVRHRVDEDDLLVAPSEVVEAFQLVVLGTKAAVLYLVPSREVGDEEGHDALNVPHVTAPALLCAHHGTGGFRRVAQAIHVHHDAEDAEEELELPQLLLGVVLRGGLRDGCLATGLRTRLHILALAPSLARHHTLRPQLLVELLDVHLEDLLLILGHDRPEALLLQLLALQESARRLHDLSGMPHVIFAAVAQLGFPRPGGLAVDGGELKDCLLYAPPLIRRRRVALLPPVEPRLVVDELGHGAHVVVAQHPLELDKHAMDPVRTLSGVRRRRRVLEALEHMFGQVEQLATSRLVLVVKLLALGMIGAAKGRGLVLESVMVRRLRPGGAHLRAELSGQVGIDARHVLALILLHAHARQPVRDSLDLVRIHAALGKEAKLALEEFPGILCDAKELLDQVLVDGAELLHVLHVGDPVDHGQVNGEPSHGKDADDGVRDGAAEALDEVVAELAPRVAAGGLLHLLAMDKEGVKTTPEEKDCHGVRPKDAIARSTDAHHALEDPPLPRAHLEIGEAPLDEEIAILQVVVLRRGKELRHLEDEMGDGVLHEPGARVEDLGEGVTYLRCGEYGGGHVEGLAHGLLAHAVHHLHHRLEDVDECVLVAVEPHEARGEGHEVRTHAQHDEHAKRRDHLRDSHVRWWRGRCRSASARRALS